MMLLIDSACEGRFTPCARPGTLVEAVPDAAAGAAAGDAMVSSACSNFDRFRNFQHQDEVFRRGAAGCERERVWLEVTKRFELD